VVEPAVAVRAVNALTARWAQAVDPSGGTVFTAAGLWPLLALLAAGAAGPARAELEQAVGLSAEAAPAQARELLADLDSRPGTGSALGLWFRRSLELRPQWLAELPDHNHGTLTADPAADQARLDAWAARHTDGLIPAMPVGVDGGTLLLLATALAVRTDWVHPFTPHELAPQGGPWAGRRLTGLQRSTPLADQAALAESPAGRLTELRVEGGDGIDVHLLLGDDTMRPADVLRTGLDLLAGTRERIPVGALPLGSPGPGIAVTEVPSLTGEPALAVTTVPFTVTREHDLLAHADLFGLATAADPEGDHFPGITASTPLAVQAARQSAVATFGALGFRAAAVTAVAMRRGAGVPNRRAKQVRVRLDRPFGFLAVRRVSGLALAAGWVAEPTEPSPAAAPAAPPDWRGRRPF